MAIALTEASIAAAEGDFIDAATRHGGHTRQGLARDTNVAHSDILDALARLRARPEGEVAALSRLLAHPDTSVRIWAALYLLPIREGEAIEALERAADEGIPRTSFGARQTLLEWRAGRLKFT